MWRSSLVALALVGGCGDDLYKVTWWEDSDRMRALAWTTDTGYRYVFGWRDLQLDVTCAAGANACAPPVAAYFADARCREFVVASKDALPAIVSYTNGNDGTGHGLQIEREFTGVVYAGWRGCVVAGATDPTYHYARARPFDDVLAPDVEPRVGGARYFFPDLAYVALADPAAIALAIETGQLHIEEGPGRLRTRYLLDSDVGLAAGIHDIRLDTTCTPGPDPAGVLRCLPPFQVPLYPDAFDDAGCTHAIGAPLYRDRGFAIVDGGYVRVDVPITAPVFVRAGDLCMPAGVADPWRAGTGLDSAELEPMVVEEVEW